MNGETASLFCELWNDELHEALLAGIHAVGEFQLEHFGGIAPEDVDTKSSHSDLVSWVDRESEKRLALLLDTLLAEAGQLGEEGLSKESRNGLRWIVDPLDGTTNYLYGHPFFCISVGLVAEREPLLGVVHAPRLGETFHAYAGSAARLRTVGARLGSAGSDAKTGDSRIGGGDKKDNAALGEIELRVSRRSDPRDTLHATGFADRRRVGPTVNLRNFERVLAATRGLRRAGSAALDLAFTAAGRVDGFWEMNLNPWDVAAGIYLVRAAGGRVSDFAGGPNALSGRAIVASNGLVHDWLLDTLEVDPIFLELEPDGL